MTGREAVIALMQGESVRLTTWGHGHLCAEPDGTIVSSSRETTWSLQEIVAHSHWEVVANPLTDEQLIAEWERFANACDAHTVYGAALRGRTLECIRQLKERKL